MIKIIPLLIAITATAINGSTTRGFDRPSFSKPGPIGIDSGFSNPGEISMIQRSTSKYIPIISYPLIKSSSFNSSSSSTAVPGYDPQTGDYFYSEKYGPFKVGDSKDTEVTFTYELNSINSQRIIERLRLLRKGSVVCASSHAAFSYTKGERKNTTFTFYNRNYLTGEGLELRFEILTFNYEILKSYCVTVFPPSRNSVLATTLKRNVYTSKTLGFYGDGKMCEIKDVFDFTKIGDYVDNDYYYRLDIGRNAFYYSNEYKITIESAFLRFYDDDNLFPNFTHESNGEIVLPLKIHQRNERLSFLFVNKFYVDKKTLDISDTYQPDYIITSSFYLPINGLRKFNGKTLYIDINGLGLDGISTTIPLKYELNRIIVSSCENGEYCVHGGTN